MRPSTGPWKVSWSSIETNIEDDVEEIVRLYDKTNSRYPTEQRPLSWHDQRRLRAAIFRYDELPQPSAVPYKEPPRRWRRRSSSEGWGKVVAGRLRRPDAGGRDAAFGGRSARLQQFAVKHRALRLVGEQCRLYQQKWQASGPLATLDAAGARAGASGLVDRHLVLREADGTLSVHPAVRDYFAGLATAAERGFWHHLIGDHLISLVRRPGWRLPRTRPRSTWPRRRSRTPLRAGRPEKAWDLYVNVLGGHRHLAWKLGEMARGLRILRGFDPCPDRWALGWYLRALGELEAAYEQNPLPYFRADIRLLQGRLPQVEAEGDPGRTEIAAFLMGRTTRLPADPLGCAIPRAQVLLYQGRAGRAWLAAEPEDIYEMTGWEDDRARCQLYRAEAACRMDDRRRA